MNMITNPFDDDKLREECGVFGIINSDSAAALTALGLHALQHRGQEAVGMVTYDGKQVYTHHALGHVGENFNADSVIPRLVGNIAVGHVRYATTGETALRNVQPLYADFDFGSFAVGHNGNLTNASLLRQQLVKRGCLFRSSTDTEVIIHLMATAIGEVVDRFIGALKQIEGAYALVGMAHNLLIGARDPYGVRPLVLGRIDGAYVLASETCAFDIIGAEFIRDIEPGEVVVIDLKGNITSLKPFEHANQRLCIFEYIYFARPDSVMDGHSVYEVRKRIGAELAREAGVEADIVVPVPDSGVPSAIGYAEESGIPFELGIIRNHYIGRTFIQPTDKIRHLGVRLKHNANRRFIEGKRVILVDDSIVRGTTSTKIVDMVRAAGAKEVHLRIASPPTKHSCFYGIDTPEPEKLLAYNYTVAQMTKYIGADSLAFVSVDGLYRATGQAGRDTATPQFCDACFTNDYPISLTDQENKIRQCAAESALKE